MDARQLRLSRWATFLFSAILVLGNVSAGDSPAPQQIAGKDCKLTEPVYGTTFDLNPLHSDVGHKADGEGKDFFEFNLCGNVTRSCGASNSYFACFHRDGAEYTIGSEAEKEPLHVDGRLYFNLTGGKCKANSDEKLNLLIILRCDYSSHVSKPIFAMPYAKDQCSLVIFQHTSQACHPLAAELTRNTCALRDQKTGRSFDLMPLSDHNHYVPYKNKKHFLINICKPNLYLHEETCPPNTSICEVDPSEADPKKKFKNFGTTVAEPVYEDGRLLMRFPSNQTCNSTHNYRAVIDFVCDAVAHFGEPVFLSEDACELNFAWVTTLACAQFEPCKVQHPITEEVFDLRSLSNTTYKVVSGNHSYVFGVCDAPKESCLAGTGACETSNGQSSSLGIASHELMLASDGTGSPYLVYESGSVCGTLNAKWNTTIEFICLTAGMSAEPTVVENTDCRLIIHFPTKLACRTTIECRMYDNDNHREIDLTPLINLNRNYLAKIGEKLKQTEPRGVLVRFLPSN